MNAVAFDTLKFARALREKAQLTNEQAEGFADAITEAFSREIATRGDVDAARSALKSDVEAFGYGLRRDVEAAKSGLTSELEAVSYGLKRDLEAVRSELKSDIKAVELRLESKIESAKSEMTRWVVGSVGFQTLVILGAVIALARLIRT